MTITCDHSDIAHACRGRARDAYSLAQNVKRYGVMRDTNILTDEGWAELKDIFGYYLNGLKQPEVEMLKILLESSPISCHNLAIKMGVEERNIEADLEIRAKELGYIDNGARGRYLTDKGKEYLVKLEQEA